MVSIYARISYEPRCYCCVFVVSLLATSLSSLCVRSMDAPSAFRLLHLGCVLCRFVVYRWCSASTAWIPYLGWLIALGRRQTLRFRVQIKVLWPEAQEHKGLDSLVSPTCEKAACHVLRLVAS
jgi:hypothetical protein